LELQQELGLAFIFISHNLGIVRHIADRIIVMENGEIVEEGKTETIFRWPQHVRTKKLVTAYQSLVPQHTIR
jgi:cationic peptide transport system ATP-binding protein